MLFSLASIWRKDVVFLVYIYLGSNQQEEKNSSKRVVMRKNGHKLNIENGHEEKWL